MALADDDRRRISTELGRELTTTETALFENLWSEHCAYRSSRSLLTSFDAEAEHVVIGPGDDAAVVAISDDTYVTLGIESHNHPSYVDPYDGAATGVGGIVRDTLSMGAYPIALADCLYFGNFDRDHSQYLLEGVVEGIADYGNAIGVPTIGGSVAFHADYAGNPLVNVACIGLLEADSLVTAAGTEPGNQLVLLGNATGRDGLGGASFASEDLEADSEIEDRPAVQVGDPYTEKLLIEANETLLDRNLVEAARDLGAAGLGGATAEMVAQGGLGATINLESVHQREAGMTATELLLAESQERMCYEVKSENVSAVTAIASRYDLGCSVIGELTQDNYVVEFDDEVVVDVPPEFLADGAPLRDWPMKEPTQPEQRHPHPKPELASAFQSILSSPNTASKRWVYRQYDHEVGVRTAVRPGDDAAVLAIRNPSSFDGQLEKPNQDGIGLAVTAGADPSWTATAPYEGAKAVVLENATNLAAKGAKPLAVVDCLNAGNPENPAVYGGFGAIIDGLAEMCATLSIPVVGGNVSLYNDSPEGPIPPTPTVAMVGTREGWQPPPSTVQGGRELVVVGDPVLAGDKPRLGGSEYYSQFGGGDAFPSLPAAPNDLLTQLATIAELETTSAVHDVSHGGLAVSFSEMVTTDAGIDASVPSRGALFQEAPGRIIVETSDPMAIRNIVGSKRTVSHIGTTTSSSTLRLSVNGQELAYAWSEIENLRDTISTRID